MKQDKIARMMLNQGGVRGARTALAALRADGRYADEDIKQEWERIGVRPDIIEAVFN